MRKPRANRVTLRAQISELLGRMAFSQTAVSLCEEHAEARDEEFLLRVLRAELANREETRRARFLREAAFPVYKTLSDYEFSAVKLPPTLSREELCSLRFIASRRNLLLYGQVGTGKTHLATALGVAACERGIRTRFFTAAELVVRLSHAHSAGTLERLLTTILRAELLIIDEWGYVPIDKTGAQLLFRVIGDSYERWSLIITTNQEFSRWGSVLTDDQMAAAIESIASRITATSCSLRGRVTGCATRSCAEKERKKSPPPDGEFYTIFLGNTA